MILKGISEALELNLHDGEMYLSDIMQVLQNSVTTLAKEQGIAIRNCDNYHGLGSGWYRIGVRLREENEELIRAMAALQ